MRATLVAEPRATNCRGRGVSSRLQGERVSTASSRGGLIVMPKSIGSIILLWVFAILLALIGINALYFGRFVAPRKGIILEGDTSRIAGTVFLLISMYFFSLLRLTKKK